MSLILRKPELNLDFFINLVSMLDENINDIEKCQSVIDAQYKTLPYEPYIHARLCLYCLRSTEYLPIFNYLNDFHAIEIPPSETKYSESMLEEELFSELESIANYSDIESSVLQKILSCKLTEQEFFTIQMRAELFATLSYFNDHFNILRHYDKELLNINNDKIYLSVRIKNRISLIANGDYSKILPILDTFKQLPYYDNNLYTTYGQFVFRYFTQRHISQLATSFPTDL